MNDYVVAWKLKQIELKKLLNFENTEKWQLDLDYMIEDLNDLKIPDDLKLIGGIDISFDSTNNELACVCFVVINAKTKLLVEKHEKIVSITEPYIVNYLAFRECEHMVLVIKEFLELHPFLKPQVLLVDGNGSYHKFKFGSACQLGVRMEQEGIKIPTIGVAKNYLQLDGMPSRDEVKQMVLDRMCDQSELLLDLTDPVTDSIICTVRRAEKLGSSDNEGKMGKLIYISPGHGITLKCAVNVVRLCSKCRVPEPILQADHHSKNFLERRKRKEKPM